MAGVVAVVHCCWFSLVRCFGYFLVLVACRFWFWRLVCVLQISWLVVPLRVTVFCRVFLLWVLIVDCWLVSFGGFAVFWACAACLGGSLWVMVLCCCDPNLLVELLLCVVDLPGFGWFDMLVVLAFATYCGGRVLLLCVWVVRGSGVNVGLVISVVGVVLGVLGGCGSWCFGWVWFMLAFGFCVVACLVLMFLLAFGFYGTVIWWLVGFGDLLCFSVLGGCWCNTDSCRFAVGFGCLVVPLVLVSCS